MSTSDEFEWVDKLKVTELKKELKTRRESMSGRKAELAQRLKDRLKEAKAAGEDVTPIEQSAEDVEPKDEKGEEAVKTETDKVEAEMAEPEKEKDEKPEEDKTTAMEVETDKKEPVVEPMVEEKQEEKEEEDKPPLADEPEKTEVPAKVVDDEPEIDDILGEDDMDDMAFNLEPAPKGKRRKSQPGKPTDQEKAQSAEATEGEEKQKDIAGDDATKDEGGMDVDQGEAVKGAKQEDVQMAEGAEEKHTSELKKRKLDDDGRPPIEGSVSSGSHEAAAKRKRVPIPVPNVKPPEAKPIVQEPMQAPSIGKVGAPSQAPPSESTQPPVPQNVSRALRINNFVRPFNDKSCRDMLEKHGEIVDMWMPSIKTHCYVLYKTEEQAMKAYNATYNLEWPRGGRKLIPHVVTVLEAQREIDRGRMRGGNPGAGSGELQGVANAGYARANSGQLGMGLDARMERAPGAPPPYPPPFRRPVSRPVTLEDLFFKTHTKPPLYYLPLTDEQVMAKKRQEVKVAMRPEDGRGESNGAIRHEPNPGNAEYRRGPPPHHLNDEKRIRGR